MLALFVDQDWIRPAPLAHRRGDLVYLLKYEFVRFISTIPSYY